MRIAFRRSMIPLAFAAMTAIVGCGRSRDAALETLPGPTVEVVNGQPVPRALLDALARGRNLDLSNSRQYDQALKELTEYILLAQEAKRENLAADPAFAAGVELNRLRGVANATLGTFQHDAKVDDQSLRATYDAQIAQAGTVDYDFSQLIFATEGEALKAESDVLSGEAFSTLIKTYAKDARSARSFSAVRANQLPEALAKSLKSLHPGDTDKVPIQTRFGWHVIHLDAIHPFTPPGFDALKDQIRKSERTKIAEQRLASLRERATITAVKQLPPASAQGADSARAKVAGAPVPTDRHAAGNDAGLRN
ncbi:MAG: peptidyl-prolyl cis-trans isomerase [Rhodanobacteraceae bacterium]